MRAHRRFVLGFAVAAALAASAAGTASARTTPPSPDAKLAASYARLELGQPYTWGGTSPGTGFDASGLVTWSFAQVGISLPHYTEALFAKGVRVPRRSLEPGDLVFFHDATHVGIYLGRGRFIHAPHTGDVVRIASLSNHWYRTGYTGAVRIS